MNPRSHNHGLFDRLTAEVGLPDAEAIRCPFVGELPKGSLHHVAACVSYRTLKRSGVLLWANLRSDAVANSFANLRWDNTERIWVDNCTLKSGDRCLCPAYARAGAGGAKTCPGSAVTCRQPGRNLPESVGHLLVTGQPCFSQPRRHASNRASTRSHRAGVYQQPGSGL